jgi:hypothetical protein
MSEEPTPEEIRRVLAYVGRTRSAKKAESSKENGKAGGRPVKPLESYACTCGRGDALEGHPTTCPRGRAIARRSRSAAQMRMDEGSGHLSPSPDE